MLLTISYSCRIKNDDYIAMQKQEQLLREQIKNQREEIFSWENKYKELQNEHDRSREKWKSEIHQREQRIVQI